MSIDLDRCLHLAERGKLKFVESPAFPWAPGHYIHDVHNFFLLLESNEIDNSLLYIYPWHQAEIPEVVKSLLNEYI